MTLLLSNRELYFRLSSESSQKCRKARENVSSREKQKVLGKSSSGSHLNTMGMVFHENSTPLTETNFSLGTRSLVNKYNS